MQERRLGKKNSNLVREAKGSNISKKRKRPKGSCSRGWRHPSLGLDVRNGNVTSETQFDERGKDRR